MSSSGGIRIERKLTSYAPVNLISPAYPRDSNMKFYVRISTILNNLEKIVIPQQYFLSLNVRSLCVWLHTLSALGGFQGLDVWVGVSHDSGVKDHNMEWY